MWLVRAVVAAAAMAGIVASMILLREGRRPTHDIDWQMIGGGAVLFAASLLGLRLAWPALARKAPGRARAGIGKLARRYRESGLAEHAYELGRIDLANRQ